MCKAFLVVFLPEFQVEDVKHWFCQVEHALNETLGKRIVRNDATLMDSSLDFVLVAKLQNNPKLQFYVFPRNSTIALDCSTIASM